ncbi:MAG: hypothetical protein K9L32_13260 [Chromatiaceae bacterium]|nr:hypothetical protein [Chromatiaceae bacterium]
MQHRDGALVVGLHCGHHPQRMQDVRSASFVGLASMGRGGDLQRGVE